MPVAYLVEYLRQHPLTPAQALRLRLLLLLLDPRRDLPQEPADGRLLALGLTVQAGQGTVRASPLAAASAHDEVGRFRLAERHPFSLACAVCQGAGIGNEEALFRDGTESKPVPCRACQGNGLVPYLPPRGGRCR